MNIAAIAEARLSPGGAFVVNAVEPPIGPLLIGRPVREAAELLPRLFNLCREAQKRAAEMALGLPFSEGDPMTEVIRDHLAKICLTLRQQFGMNPMAPPRNVTAEAIFGPARCLPESLAEFGKWSSSDLPAAELAARIRVSFRDGEATSEILPAPPDDLPLAAGAFENSPAGRQQAHPLLQEVEKQSGRGPLWRYLGMLADLEAVMKGDLTPPVLQGDIAVVQAARGSYALRLTASEDRITGIWRRTPTDHILASGGAMEQSLCRLAPARQALASRVIALHDPCYPVSIRGT